VLSTRRTPITTPINSITISHQKVDVQADYAMLIQGLQAEAAPEDPIVIGGQTIARADLVARLQQRIDAAARTKAARAGLQKAVSDERTLDAEVRTLRAHTKLHLQGKYGRRDPKLQDFGFTQGHAPKATAQTKASAQVKAKTTREALGTKGSQQKKKARAALEASSPTPRAPATPASPTVPAAPSAPATGNGASSAPAASTTTPAARAQSS
jgi:hypothetical protein